MGGGKDLQVMRLE